MNACTFRPNVPQHAVAAGAATRVADTIGSESCATPQPKGGSHSGEDGAGSGDVGGGDGDGGGAGGGGVSSFGCRLPGADSKGSAGPSSQRSLDGTAAAQRLFEETGRLGERRFEGQERKRMWEEEVYARTCTFEVSKGLPRKQLRYFASAQAFSPRS